ncbi:LuxR C-terminal-related transcriptional regulator [Qipengyuania sp. G39]|uniref:LuxR C-terminal-related transcriptional regulator n=1 Tax=Qipengyuania profundimaris TaxID=3067652 RepID=A0ABT9HSB9_9SPHN|nr:LuxR C-terminal-related transcriptional regulator [Qipengyuania sp. G39]MDP4576044.1 LuxR C-terminal-related transcriptional regulator [Qipengyuania sp. G39]
MSDATYVHIVDQDSARRAKMAFQLYGSQIHAEIYGNLEELIDRRPSRGVVLISDDPRRADLKPALEVMQMETGYLPVGMFSSAPTPRKIVEAMSNVVLDYLEWPCSTDALIDAVRRLVEVGARRGRRERRRAEARKVIGLLTGREMDVLKGLVDGASNKEIARRLGISPRTVEIHRANMMGRLNAQSVADAVRIGLYAGLDS